MIERFVRELAQVEFGGPERERNSRLQNARSLCYNDLSADRQVVAAVQALEAILDRAATGSPDAVVRVNDAQGGLVLYQPGDSKPEVLYKPAV